MPDRPLITFAVSAYNQERYIAKAIEGALSQDYFPLEVIISDDCSNDNTYEIIVNVTNRYSGTHKIVINRNPVNLGLVRHLSHVFNMARGEIIVDSGGDDVSLPDRVSKVQRCFAQFPKAKAVFTNGMMINEDDEELGPFSGMDRHVVWDSLYRRLSAGTIYNFFGFSAAYKKELVLNFPEIDAEIVQEDVLLLVRALLLGEVIYMPDMTVRYRRHAETITSKILSAESGRMRYHKGLSALWKQAIGDCSYVWASDSSGQNVDRRLIKRMQAEKRISDLNLKCFRATGVARLTYRMLIFQQMLFRRVERRIRHLMLSIRRG